jgi:hypothetical protein
MYEETMSEKPITFSIDMVRATITCARCGKISVPFPCEHCGSEDFVKTVTRRVIKLPPDVEWKLSKERDYQFEHYDSDGLINGLCIRKPKYQKGDHLWVRETWSITQLEAPDGSLEYPNILYKTDSSTRLFLNQPAVWKYNIPNNIFKWRPSIHMPKWAARIWLEVLNIRPEELQDISINDIRAEGVRDTRTIHNEIVETYFEKFQQLWDSLNAKGGHLWESNPLVWRYEFKRINK